MFDLIEMINRKLLQTLIFSLLIVFSACKKEISKPKVDIPIVAEIPKKVFEVDYSKPIWFDEFEINGKPNPVNWGYDLGGNGWGNRELQMYTNAIENAEVKNGMLNISALSQQIGSNSYSSARIVSKSKGDFLYGRIEIKAKLPMGVGTWPAIWMLATKQEYGDQYWPDNGEIDIMEHVGFDQNIVHGNIHTKSFNHAIGTNKGNSTSVKDASETFNIYAINWYPESIVFEINGKQYFQFDRQSDFSWSQWPFDKPFHLLLNIAVGGSWGGQKGVDETVFPQTMSVDYVRVYGLKEKK
jgi:beta-glucanase (GH16 family)